MSATVTFRFTSTPDTPPEGQPPDTTVLDIQSVFTLDDEHAYRLLDALQSIYTTRARGREVGVDGQPIPPGAPLYVPPPDQAITRAIHQMWTGLKETVENYYRQAAAQSAAAQIPDLKAEHSATVNMADVPVTPRPPITVIVTTEAIPPRR